MSISTKKGDHGQTVLASCLSQNQKIEKDNLTVNVLGSLDETNSFLGLAASLDNDKNNLDKIRHIQNDICTASSVLAGASLAFNKAKTTWLEKQIRLLEKQLPPLSHFLLPGGSSLASSLHICRTVVRRAERELVSLQKVRRISGSILSYFNRLSDFLFLAAREANQRKEIKETLWFSAKSKKQI